MTKDEIYKGPDFGEKSSPAAEETGAYDAAQQAAGFGVPTEALVEPGSDSQLMQLVEEHGGDPRSAFGAELLSRADGQWVGPADAPTV